MDIQEVHHHLTQHGIKSSMQRVVIMQYLMEHKTHPTIDQIFSDLLPSVPTLSKTTVYNTLKLFYDKKAVISLAIDDRNVRYDAETSDHAHFKCRKCGAIFDVPLEKTDIPAFRGHISHNPDEIQIYFLGVCGECLKG
ncbi:MAG: transcriptional repressor [Bacteroidales bacterium]|jgi:Fur family ferric uptake transcriptional regulator/Fur family peroxide stress response transcriptional regulator|nr:transcriptional repressor [Bacteroidales bacterium]